METTPDTMPLQRQGRWKDEWYQCGNNCCPTWCTGCCLECIGVAQLYQSVMDETGPLGRNGTCINIVAVLFGLYVLSLIFVVAFHVRAFSWVVSILIVCLLIIIRQKLR